MFAMFKPKGRAGGWSLDTGHLRLTGDRRQETGLGRS